MTRVVANSATTDLPLSDAVPATGRNAKQKAGLVFGWFIDLATLAVGGAALAPLFARYTWYCELASHFRLQYGVLLALSSLVYLIARQWRTFAAAALLATVNLWMVLSIARPALPAGNQPLVRLLECNVYAGNRQHDRLISRVRASRPHLALFVEVSFDWADSLHALDAEYPYSQIVPAPGSGGIALFSRLPLEDVELTDVGGSGWTLVLIARTQLGGRKVTLIGVHTYSPISPEALQQRNLQLVDLAALVRQQEGPVIVLGDLNTSPWSPYFGDLLNTSNLRDSRQGFGIQASWPTQTALVRIPIDHILASKEIAIHQRYIGPYVGSDHFPVAVDLSLWPQEK